MCPTCNSKESVKRTWIFVFCFLFVSACLLAPDLVNNLIAGTGGPLDDVYTDLSDWSQGNVGKTISIAMMLVGIVAGVARQSLMAFAIGIGGGLGLSNSPAIIDTIFTATLV